MSGGHEDGYTLLETLVAFTILAGGLALSLSASTLGLRSLSAASQNTRMMAQAEIVFDQIAARSVLSTTSETARNGVYTWRSTITALPESSPSYVIKPFRVSVEVSEIKSLSSRTATVTTILLRRSGTP